MLQKFQIHLFHNLISTYHFNFIIFNYSYFHFWNRIPQHLLISQKPSYGIQLKIKKKGKEVITKILFDEHNWFETVKEANPDF